MLYFSKHSDVVFTRAGTGKALNGYTFEVNGYTGSKPMSSQDFPYFQKSKKILHSHWLGS